MKTLNRIITALALTLGTIATVGCGGAGSSKSTPIVNLPAITTAYPNGNTMTWHGFNDPLRGTWRDVTVTITFMEPAPVDSSIWMTADDFNSPQFGWYDAAHGRYDYSRKWVGGMTGTHTLTFSILQGSGSGDDTHTFNYTIDYILTTPT